MLEVGSIAPDFTLLDQNGDSVSLSNFVGKKIILYFYSKDNTPGCTKQACGYAQNYPRFKEKDTIIIGISKDTVVSHKKFEEKYQLPFILLANPELDVLQAYDVWKEKNMYGRMVMGVVRTTYLINEEGIIEKAFTKVKAADDAERMLREIERLRVNKRQMQLIIGILVIIIIVLLVYRNHRQETAYQRISASEAQKIMDEESNIIIIDVRTVDEYKTGHIKNAICIPNELISNKEIAELPDKSQEILVYCRSGSRSRQAANKLIKLGYENVIDFGGIIDWDGEVVK